MQFTEMSLRECIFQISFAQSDRELCVHVQEASGKVIVNYEFDFSNQGDDDI